MCLAQISPCRHHGLPSVHQYDIHLTPHGTKSCMRRWQCAAMLVTDRRPAGLLTITLQRYRIGVH
jgi:hypothetical protein